MAVAISDWSQALDHVQHAAQLAWTPSLLDYSSSSALAIGIQYLLIFIFGCWFASIVTGNYSHTDRLWSITPFVYVWHFAFKAYLEDNGQWNDRLVIMGVLSTLWGMRLTFNFARKGGYSLSEEDYRWGVLRQYLHWTLYQVFNIVFIAGYQHLLLFLIVLPAYAAYAFRSPLNQLDYVASALFLALLLLETIADQQQWNFYKRKYQLIAAKKPLTGDYKAGFNRSGLFRYSRHPNFFAEFSIWCTFYVFSVAASGVAWNPTAIGAILLVLLFQGSTVFTEWITATKYPEYKLYQQSVSSLVPWFPATAKSHTT